MHVLPLKLPLRTLKLCGNSLEIVQGLKFKFENPWNKCRCCHSKKFKGGNSRVKIASYLSIRGQTLNLYLSTMKIKGNSGVIWPLKKFRGYNSRSESISEEKETVNLYFSTMTKTQELFRMYQIWPLKKIFRGLNSKMKQIILSLPCWNSRVKGTLRFSITLQELKLRGIKSRDGVVFSQYSRAQCFAIKLSDFG